MNRYLVTNLFGTGINIAWYAVIMCVGIIAGTVTAYFLSKKRGFKFDLIIDYLIIAIPLAVICARLYYVVFEWNYYFVEHPEKIVAVWEGGLAIYGAVIGAVIAAVIFCKWKKFPIAHLLDFGGCGLIIGQAIGRWGNFVNQEAFGTAVTNPDFQWFPFAVHIDKIPHSIDIVDEYGILVNNFQCTEPWHLATFFYESVWNLIVFGVLLWFFYKKAKRPGNVFALYLIGYGIGRTIIEGLRTDSLWLIPGVIRISQVLSLVLVIGSILYLILVRKKPIAEPYYGPYCLDYAKDAPAENESGNTAEAEEIITGSEESQPEKEEQEAGEPAGEASEENKEVTQEVEK